MFKAFFTDNGTFINYSSEHYLTIIFWFIFGFLFIYYSKKLLSPEQQKRTIVLFCILIALSQISKVFIKLKLGVFDPTEDLPLHLCNMMPLLIPIALYLHKRAIWAVLFLWIMAGTFQSLLTPTLKDSFPHYEYFRYWIVHCGLVIAALYPIFVWGYRLKFKDLIIGVIAMHALALLMYFVNLGLNSNYMYLMGKPDGDTIYNLLGPWPWYLLSLEGVMAVLFLLLYLPFYLVEKFAKKGKD